MPFRMTYRHLKPVAPAAVNAPGENKGTPVMHRTSALFTRGIIAFAAFAIENAAIAQTFSSPAGIFPPPPQWLSFLQPQRGAGWYQTPMRAPTVSPLWNGAAAGVPASQPGSWGEYTPAVMPANQSGGVCRSRRSARSLEFQRNRFGF
jgi:hypothetical protein